MELSSWQTGSKVTSTNTLGSNRVKRVCLGRDGFVVEPKLRGVGETSDLNEAQTARYLGQFVEAAARIAGGCCGSMPAEIMAVAEAVSGL